MKGTVSQEVARPAAAALVAAGLALVMGFPGCGPSSGSAPATTGTAHGKTVQVSQATFAAQVEDSSGVVVVDFWAPWCGPCRVVGPVLEELSVEFDGRVKICKLNVDENQKLAARFEANAIPMLVLFKDGKAEDRLVGARTRATYRSWFEKYL